MHWINLHI